MREAPFSPSVVAKEAVWFLVDHCRGKGGCVALECMAVKPFNHHLATEYLVIPEEHLYWPIELFSSEHVAPMVKRLHTKITANAKFYLLEVPAGNDLLTARESYKDVSLRVITTENRLTGRVEMRFDVCFDPIEVANG